MFVINIFHIGLPETSESAGVDEVREVSAATASATECQQPSQAECQQRLIDELKQKIVPAQEG